MCVEPRTRPEDATDLPLTRVCETVDELSTTLVNARIYRPDHPRVRLSADEVATSLADLGGRASLRLSVADDVLVFDEQPLIGSSMTATRLIEGLERWGAGGLELDHGTSADDVIRLLEGIAQRPLDQEDWEDLNTRLADCGCRSARLLAPFREGTRATPAAQMELRVPLRFYQSCVDTLQDVTVSVCHGGKIEFGPVRTHVETVLRNLEDGAGSLLSLARQDQYDAFTFGHSVRVGVLAMNFARTLTDDHELLVRIGTAALLHDCGKALIPFEILHSRKPLGDDERLEMNRHPEFGAEILVDHQESDPLSIAAAFGHHRSCDGRGYPPTEHVRHSLLVNEIVKICDVYEALTAARPYKRPMPPIRAYRVMIGMGDHLDRTLLRRFITANGVYPAGQHVRLSTGERARVHAQTDAPQAPVVEVLTDVEDHALAVDERTLVDLRAPRSGAPGPAAPTGIVGIVPADLPFAG